MATPPDHLIATIPYQYSPTISPAAGVFGGTSIVKNPTDGFYYILLHVEPYLLQPAGACVVCTNDLSDPTSCRAWDGDGFDVRFINPYTEVGFDLADHVCVNVTPAGLHESLTFNTYYNQWMAIGSAFSQTESGQDIYGFFFSLSDDLVNWGPLRFIMDAKPIWAPPAPRAIRGPILRSSTRQTHRGTSR